MRPKSFPNSRAVLLAPGQFYVEAFDPHLLCFGKNAAALRGSVEVRTTFGWSPPSKWSHKPPSPPFAAEGTAYPATVAPLPQLVAPTIVLSFAKATPAPSDASPKGDAPNAGADPAASGDHRADAAKSDADAAPKPAADAKAGAKGDEPRAKGGDEKGTKGGAASEKEPPAIVDENAGRLELELGDYADASAAHDVRVEARISNAGHRPITAALRPRMLAFRVIGPNGVQTCDAAPPTQAMPREAFHSLAPGKKVSFSVLLAEECPELKLDRPGLYRVEATLRALEGGDHIGLEAWTGSVAATDTALVRIATGTAPFYKGAPAAVPTPKPAPPPDEDD
jgi:hypothetical protein